jgi:flagellar biosynthesis protein FlhB
MPEENDQGQEKTEAPTGRRRQKAREKGSVARSKEINSSVLLLFAVAVTALYGPYLAQSIVDFTRAMFLHFPEYEISMNNVHTYMAQLFLYVLKLVMPVFLVFMIIGVVVNLAQFGFLYTTQTIFQGVKNMTLNPTKVIQKMFSGNNWVQLAINIGKLFILVYVAYHTLKDEVNTIPLVLQWSVPEILSYAFKMLFVLSLKIIALLLILSAIDFIWQKLRHEKSLKMTKQEVKEEVKQMEGDPKIKRQIRSAQQRMALSRMIRKVPEADVVITNPFHLAVAVKYDPARMNAPMVIAKGARLIAEKIKDIARWNSVPIIENKPLAQTLYKTIDIGGEIPPKLYQAVAEILAYVYRLNKAKARRFATVS